jgi:hypothetical protein
LDIKKHEKISVPVATVNSANMVTLFTEDGKIVHRLVYQIRNSAKQFLEIQLPEKADVWSVFVGNEPVESSINSQGKLLVPLIRSRSVNNRLDTFPVEVILCLGEDRFAWYGSRKSTLPAVDLLISHLIWSVYLPNDYSYLYFQSSLEKEEIIRGLNVLQNVQRRFNDTEAKDRINRPEAMSKEKLSRVYKGKDYKSEFRNVPLQEEQISSQVAAELEFSGRLEGLAEQDQQQLAAPSGGKTGLLPIQIQIPTGGQVYRFAKTIVKPEDPLYVGMAYTQNWLLKAGKWVAVVIVLWIFFLLRRQGMRFLRWLLVWFRGLHGWYKRHEKTIKHYAGSKMTPVVCLGLIGVFFTISRFLTLIAVFFLWISIMYLFFQYREQKAKQKLEIEE